MTKDNYFDELGQIAVRYLRSAGELQRVRARLRASAEALSKLGADLTEALEDDQKLLVLLDDSDYGDALQWSYLASQHGAWKAAYDEYNQAENLLDIQRRKGNL